MLPAPEPVPADLGLDNWTQWLESRDPAHIDLGLERPRRVLQRMRLPARRCPLITVAGTNGKGSVVATIDAIAGASGVRCGAYLSPHILRFNERVRIDGADVDDPELVQAFKAVAAAEGDDRLSYFEFTTLAAFWLFARQDLDLWVLEVGLGGRLDAVNLLDADVAVITSIGMDHTDWLGDSLDTIATEKAGILQPGKPLVLGPTAARPVVLAAAESAGAPTWRLGNEIATAAQGAQWSVAVPGLRLDGLPPPVLPGAVQRDNAALALAAVHLAGLPTGADAVAAGLAAVRLPGRCQIVSQAPLVVLDTAHNAEAAAALADALGARPVHGRTIGVLGMLAGKPVDAVVAALAGQVDAWHWCGLPGARGQSAAQLQARGGAQGTCYRDVAVGLQAALEQAGEDDRIVVLGSFHTVEAALTLLGKSESAATA